MSTFDTFCESHGMRAEVKYGNKERYDTSDDWRREADPWTVTLKYKGRRLTVPFWTGFARTNEPTAADVLNCLISDSDAVGRSFEDWASDLGYDTDSRKAEQTWKLCCRIGMKVRKFLARDFDVFADASREH